MKDIVLLSNKPWKHTMYLKRLSEMTGSKVIAFICGKLRIYPDIFMSTTDSLCILGDCGIEMSFAPKEAYDEVQSIFKDAKIKLIYWFDEMEEFYTRENTVIIVDIEPDNDLGFIFCERYSDDEDVIAEIFYSAETRVAIEHLTKKFDYEKILIPHGYFDGKIEYKDYTKLINMVK